MIFHLFLHTSSRTKTHTQKKNDDDTPTKRKPASPLSPLLRLKVSPSLLPLFFQPQRERERVATQREEQLKQKRESWSLFKNVFLKP
jgi:hypothetical protein